MSPCFLCPIIFKGKKITRIFTEILPVKTEHIKPEIMSNILAFKVIVTFIFYIQSSTAVLCIVTVTFLSASKIGTNHSVYMYQKLNQ